MRFWEYDIGKSCFLLNMYANVAYFAFRWIYYVWMDIPGVTIDPYTIHMVPRTPHGN